MAPRSRAGIINNGTLTWNRTHNPRRHPCPHCGAPPAAPCRNGPRTLTFYHAPRINLANNQPEPDTDSHTHPPQLPTPPPPPQPPTPRQPLAQTRHQRAATWLHHQLTQLGGTAPAQDIVKAAHAAGYSRTTLHRARTRLGITTHQVTGQPHGGWHWNLTTPQLEPDLPPLAKASLTEAGQLTLTINNRARDRRAHP